MVEISTSILSVKKGEESKTFFALEKAKTDYFHIDVMDGKFVEKDTYQKMLEYASYIKRISNLPLDIHLMVEDINTAIDDFASVEPNIITFHYEVCKNKEEVMEVIKKILDDPKKKKDIQEIIEMANKYLRTYSSIKKTLKSNLNQHINCVKMEIYNDITDLEKRVKNLQIEKIYIKQMNS